MKTEVVRVRLTEMEKEKFIDHAEGLNMSISDYIKYCCLVEPPNKPKQKAPRTFLKKVHDAVERENKDGLPAHAEVKSIIKRERANKG